MFAPLGALGAAAITLLTLSTTAVAGNCGSCSNECSDSKAHEKINAAIVHASSVQSPGTIVDIAAENGNFNTLIAAAKAAGLVSALNGDGPITVFAPTDDAFAKLPTGTVENLLKPENKELLQAILTFHVVAGEVDSATALTLTEAETLQGQRLDIDVERSVMGEVTAATVNGANLIATDIHASNGIIHVIDTVMLPETMNAVEVADNAGTFKTLLAAAKAAGLAETLATAGPITILAPTDDAFAKLPAGTVESLLKPEGLDTLKAILKYHVISGAVYDEQAVKAGSAVTLQGGHIRATIQDGRLFINNAAVVASDIESSNAVIHVIDTVLIPE